MYPNVHVFSFHASSEAKEFEFNKLKSLNILIYGIQFAMVKIALTFLFTRFYFRFSSI